ncbi:MAG: sugar ABC transporter permease [Clostridia bacterium]|nr:sugar ABC transporter permease [Clostridia bacterium]
MDKKTMGTVIAASKQWWLKINTKPVRMHVLDGAIFPYIIKVKYTVDGKEYIKRKWISAGNPVPNAGSSVTVVYSEYKPSKAKIL